MWNHYAYFSIIHNFKCTFCQSCLSDSMEIDCRETNCSCVCFGFVIVPVQHKEGQWTDQPSCRTLSSLIEPHVRHHGRQAGTPHSWHKQRLLTDLMHIRVEISTVYQKNSDFTSKQLSTASDYHSFKFRFVKLTKIMMCMFKLHKNGKIKSCSVNRIMSNGVYQTTNTLQMFMLALTAFYITSQ